MTDRVCLSVDPGVCGFSCNIKAWKKEKRVAGFEIVESRCEMIKKLSADLNEMNMNDLFIPVTGNPIFISAQRAGCHLACPVPTAIVKTVEVTLGLAVPKDVGFNFEQKC